MEILSMFMLTKATFWNFWLIGVWTNAGCAFLNMIFLTGYISNLKPDDFTIIQNVFEIRKAYIRTQPIFKRIMSDLLIFLPFYHIGLSLVFIKALKKYKNQGVQGIVNAMVILDKTRIINIVNYEKV